MIDLLTTILAACFDYQMFLFVSSLRNTGFEKKTT